MTVMQFRLSIDLLLYDDIRIRLLANGFHECNPSWNVDTSLLSLYFHDFAASSYVDTNHHCLSTPSTGDGASVLPPRPSMTLLPDRRKGYAVSLITYRYSCRTRFGQLTVPSTSLLTICRQGRCPGPSPGTPGGPLIPPALPSLE